MALSYEFSIGSVRAKETSLLSAQDTERLLGCRDTAQLCSTLSDLGIGKGNSVDAVLAQHEKETWAYLKSVAPDFDIFTPFIIANDIHNFKVTLKGIMAEREYKHLMLSPNIVPHETMIKAVENRRMSLLPEFMQKPCDEAYELLAHTGDARAADSVLDRALMDEMLRLSKQYRSAFLREYFQTQIFYNNVKIAIRASRAKPTRDYLEKSLCEVPHFRKKEIIDAALKGYDSLIGELSKDSACECDKAMEAYKESPSAFEKFTDDKLMRLARESCKRTCEGAEPLLGYYLGREAEKKMIHIIASGIRTGADVDNIRERLREIYG